MLLTWASSRSRPSLVLNFLQGIADPRITYSGGANGTRVNSAGVIVAATAPRFDYNPVTLAARGLLVEEARTNLLLRSADFGTTWALGGSTISAAATTSPDGATNGTKLQEDNATSSHIVQQFVAYSNATSYTLTTFLKASDRDWGWLFFPGAAFSTLSGSYFDLANGVVGSTFGAGVTATITPAGNGWYRCSITKTSTAAASGNTGIGVATADLTNNYLGTTGNGIFIWGAQLEAGSFPTSYIPTTTASVTRTADTAVMTGTNFSSWYNQTQGTFVATGMTNRPFGAGIGGQMLSAATDGNNRMWVAQGTTANALDASVYVGGVVVGSVATGGASAGLTDMRAAFAYAANNFAASLNGATPGTDVSGSVPTCNALYIGGSISGSAAGNWNGHIRTIQYYPQRLSNSQLQALTA